MGAYYASGRNAFGFYRLADFKSGMKSKSIIFYNILL